MVLAHFSLGNLARIQGRSEESSKYFENTIVLLDRYQPEDMLPESDGMTAKRLRQVIENLTFQAKVA
jgi:chemotaxis protein methyltransferase CheR